MQRRSARGRARGSAHVLSSLGRFYMGAGGPMLAVGVFLATSSLWALALLVPWFIVARVFGGLTR